MDQSSPSNSPVSLPPMDNMCVDAVFLLINHFALETDFSYPQLLNQIAAGKTVDLDFSFRPVTVPNTLTGNYTSIFSATGPTNDMYMKPDLVAVGGSESTALKQYRSAADHALS